VTEIGRISVVMYDSEFQRPVICFSAACLLLTSCRVSLVSASVRTSISTSY